MREPSELLSDEEMRHLIEWIDWWHSGVVVRPPRSEALTPYALARHAAPEQFLRVVALEAGRRRDASWAKLLIERATDMDSMFNHTTTALESYCADAVEVLLAGGAKVTRSVRQMARSPRKSQRVAVARGLSERDPLALPLLERLAGDEAPEVRQPARKKLQRIQEVDYWIGLFDQDPLARLEPEEAERVGPHVTAIIAYTDTPQHEVTEAQTDAFVKAVARLPDDLAAEFLRRFIGAHCYLPVSSSLVADFALRPNAAGALWELLAANDAGEDDSGGRLYSVGMRLVEWLKAAEGAAVRRICNEWAERIVSHQLATRSGDLDEVTALLLRSLSELWRPGMDASPIIELLERCVAAPEVEDLWQVTSALATMLVSDPDTVRAQPFRVIHLLEGTQNTRQLRAAVQAFDDVQRKAFAEKYQDSSKPEFQHLAREIVLGALEQRGDAQAELDAFDHMFSDAGFRAHVFDNAKLRTRFADRLRSRLREGALELFESAKLLSALPDATEAEWALYREAQRHALSSGSLEGVLAARAPGPWHRDDLALLEDAVLALKTGVESGVPVGGFKSPWSVVPLAVSTSRAPELKETLEALIELSLEADVPAAIVMLRNYEDYCKALGLEPRRFELPREDDD